MIITKQIALLVFVCLNSLAFAQVAPPPGHSVAWQNGYVEGFGDGGVAATQPAAPSWPADVVFHPDWTYHIAPAPDGSDQGGNGSVIKPFATIDRAIQQLHNDRQAGQGPKLAEIAYRADGTYTQNKWLADNDLLIDSYPSTGSGQAPSTGSGQAPSTGSGRVAGPEQRPTITSTDVPFAWQNVKDVHLQNLRIVGDPNGSNFGFYVGAGDDVSADYCEFDGFGRFGVCIIGTATHVRLYHNYIANSYTAGTNTESCSGLYTEANAPDVECNIIYHNGWRAPFDLKNAALVQSMMFRHGWYENPGNGASVAGTDKFNIYFRNATTGHQCRVGGSAVLWGVFWDNGNAADVFTGPGFQHNLGGEIGHCVFFGNLTSDFACWGGGATGESMADNLHDLLFSGTSTMQLPPAITIHWSPGNGPVPAGTKATVTNCRGIWRAGGVTLLDGRTATITNVHIRKPGPGEHAPSLLDFLGTKDDESSAQLLRTHLHDSKYSAQAIIEWAARSIPN
jgi:hypothetical protein